MTKNVPSQTFSAHLSENSELYIQKLFYTLPIKDTILIFLANFPK